MNRRGFLSSLVATVAALRGFRSEPEGPWTTEPTPWLVDELDADDVSFPTLSEGVRRSAVAEFTYEVDEVLEDGLRVTPVSWRWID